MTHKIIVDKNKCIGCGACVAACSGSFEMKDGKAHAVKSEVEKFFYHPACRCPAHLLQQKFKTKSNFKGCNGFVCGFRAGRQL